MAIHRKIHKFEYKLVLKKIYRIYLNKYFGEGFDVENIKKGMDENLEYDTEVSKLIIKSKNVVMKYNKILSQLPLKDDMGGECGKALERCNEGDLRGALDIVKDEKNTMNENCRFVLAKTLNNGLEKAGKERGMWSIQNLIGVWRSMLLSEKYMEIARLNIGLLQIRGGEVENGIDIMGTVNSKREKNGVLLSGLYKLSDEGTVSEGVGHLEEVRKEIPDHIIKLLMDNGIMKK
jgi:hypothetical protein